MKYLPLKTAYPAFELFLCSLSIFRTLRRFSCSKLHCHERQGLDGGANSPSAIPIFDKLLISLCSRQEVL